MTNKICKQFQLGTVGLATLQLTDLSLSIVVKSNVLIASFCCLFIMVIPHNSTIFVSYRMYFELIECFGLVLSDIL